MTSAPKPRLPKPSADHRLLEAFIGKWHAKGTSYADGQRADDPLASGVAWTSDETYEWLPGGFFVLHRWDAMAGEREFKGTEIMGYDKAEGGHFTRFFDNAGNHPNYRAQVKENVWTFTEAVTRATVTVSDDGNNMKFHWQWRNDGSDWLPLCDRTATRIR